MRARAPQSSEGHSIVEIFKDQVVAVTMRGAPASTMAVGP